jgi:hypothetical protein
MGRWFEEVDLSSMTANIAWRKRAVARAEKDFGYRRMVRWQCANDMTYFLQAWSWLHEPREGMFTEHGEPIPKVFPFLLRPHQDEYVQIVEKALGKETIGIRKCRDEGFSWIFVDFAERDFTFKSNIDIGLCSSTKDKADMPGIMKSLGGKLDWSIAQKPAWFLGRRGKRVGEGDWVRNGSDSMFIHHRLHNSITFDAATGEGPRSGRYTWYLFDEFGTREWWHDGSDKRAMEAVGAATKSKVYVSTPEGTSNEFHRLMTEPSRMTKIEMDWRANPAKAQGMYRLHHGKVIAVDPVNDPLPAHYNPPTDDVRERWDRLRKKGFNLEKGTRSEWYDNECDQPEATPEMIAKNVDAEWGGSVAKIFDDQFFEVAKNTIKTPLLRGNFSVADDKRWEWAPSETGQFHLWCNLDAHQRPPQHQYVVCADLGHGRGGPYTSNSALLVFDLVTKEQVLEFASNVVEPWEFSCIAIGVCRWFHEAYFAWEVNQPGNVVIDVVREQGYSNFYRRSKLDQITKQVTMKPGWHTDPKTKEKMFVEFRMAVKTGELILRSRALVEECAQYIRDPKQGSIQHSAEGKGHGDRVMAACVGAQAAKERPVISVTQKGYVPWGDGPPPYGTAAHRQWEYDREQRDRSDDWDDRTTYDLSQHGRALIGARR